ncbi:MAG: small multi-drug export protein, partial [Candidatus Poseidoniaceae archaeon]|nr:small multi-drug export protein [Candidatus Poseidoniaceae archaeon]
MPEGKGDSGDETEHIDHEVKAHNKITKELVEIRNRRTGDDTKSFLAKKENFVLAGGVLYTILYVLLILGMTSGTFGNSTYIDHAASNTFLDIGGECEEITDEPWILIWPNDDAGRFSMNGYNLPTGYAHGTYTIVQVDEEGGEKMSWTNSSTKYIKPAGESDAGRMYFAAPFDGLEEGVYDLSYSISVYNQSNHSDPNASIVEGGEEISKSVEFELDISKQTFAFLPFVDSEKKQQIRMTDTGARSCWGVQDLGNWGYVLIGAELGGGRETAMLAGGAAGIPAWWMAFSSLSLSAISLLIIYPLMYKVYHQDSDDILSRTHISRLVEDSINKTAHRLNIDIDWELYKIEPRDLSIDIMVPYKNTESTLSDSKDVRAEVLREVLEEFAIFRVFKPVQLTVRTIGVNQAIDFESGVGIGTSAHHGTNEEEQNYSDFFSELHTLSRVEDEVRESLELFFARRNDLKMEAAVVTSDDRVIFVSVIYRPTQRFAFFRFKKTRDEVQTELHHFISKRNADLLGSQELIVKGRNQVSTLSERSGAGRVERDLKNDERIVAVAKQDGFGGKMLQTKLLGDTLSTVEYMANEKREMINKWGFWGLIVFVWIPFMASGVLVGAMLGLLSRMNFMRVLSATIIGGSIASITWAYTAEGIVKFMHQYKLEAVIPLIIIVFVGAAFLHIRSTKMRRQT